MICDMKFISDIVTIDCVLCNIRGCNDNNKMV